MGNILRTAYIGLGANLGDARNTVEQAIWRLDGIPESRLSTRSSLYCSAPIDASGDDFINAVVELHTTLSAHQLLKELQSIEQEFGRKRPYQNAPRTLDLDLLLMDEQQINDEHLTVPHPRMTERAFVLLPLLEVSPFVQIPGKGDAHQWLAKVKHQSINPI